MATATARRGKPGTDRLGRTAARRARSGRSERALSRISLGGTSTDASPACVRSERLGLIAANLPQIDRLTLHRWRACALRVPAVTGRRENRWEQSVSLLSLAANYTQRTSPKTLQLGV